MTEWQPIETAPADKLVKLGGWVPDQELRIYGRYDEKPKEPVWFEDYAVAFTERRGFRQKLCSQYMTHWQMFDRSPPTGDA